MAKLSPDARDVQQTRGVLIVVVMLLLAGVVTILFAAGTLSNEAPKHGGAKQTLTIGDSR